MRKETYGTEEMKRVTGKGERREEKKESQNKVEERDKTRKKKRLSVYMNPIITLESVK